MRAAEGAPRGPRRCRCRSRSHRCGGSNISYLSLSLLTLRCQGCRAGGGQIANAVSFPYWRGTWGREGGKKGVFAHSGFSLELGSLLPKDAPSCALLPTSPCLRLPADFPPPDPFARTFRRRRGQGQLGSKTQQGLCSLALPAAATAGKLRAYSAKPSRRRRPRGFGQAAAQDL